MSVLRARSSCPRCSSEEEVWYYRGKLEPTESTDCRNCGYLYNSSDFIVVLLDLYQNVTISAYSAQTTMR
jgi:hypothetical protein